MRVWNVTHNSVVSFENNNHRRIKTITKRVKKNLNAKRERVRNIQLLQFSLQQSVRVINRSSLLLLFGYGENLKIKEKCVQRRDKNTNVIRKVPLLVDRYYCDDRIAIKTTPRWFVRASKRLGGLFRYARGHFLPNLFFFFLSFLHRYYTGTTTRPWIFHLGLFAW